MNSTNKDFSADLIPLIKEKLNAYPEDIRELALLAISLSEARPGTDITEELLAAIRKLVKKQDGDSK